MSDDPAAAAEDYSGENLDEVLLTEVEVAGSRRYIVYRNGAMVDAAELEQLCDKVGWPRRPLNKVQAALANSFLVSALFLEAQPPESSADGMSSSSSDGGGAPPPGSRLIGLARCTSDGAFNATIWDVLVDPEFQGQVGTRVSGGGAGILSAAPGLVDRLPPTDLPASCWAGSLLDQCALQHLYNLLSLSQRAFYCSAGDWYAPSPLAAGPGQGARGGHDANAAAARGHKHYALCGRQWCACDTKHADSIVGNSAAWGA